MNSIERKDYLDKLVVRKENGLVKILTGIRRCGKYFILDSIFKNHLLECRVKKKILIVKDDIKLWRNEEGIVIIGIQKFILNPNSLEL